MSTLLSIPWGKRKQYLPQLVFSLSLYFPHLLFFLVVGVLWVRLLCVVSEWQVLGTTVSLLALLIHTKRCMDLYLNLLNYLCYCKKL